MYLFLFCEKNLQIQMKYIFLKRIFCLFFQLERDIMIWNNKRYERKPLFVKSKEDSQVAKHRRWFSQFYSENSPRLKFQKDTLEWWRLVWFNASVKRILLVILLSVYQNGIHSLQATIIETQPAIRHHVIFSTSFICST